MVKSVLLAEVPPESSVPVEAARWALDRCTIILQFLRRISLLNLLFDRGHRVALIVAEREPMRLEKSGFAKA